MLILRTFGRHMATEFSEKFFLLIHLRASQNVSFVRKHLSRQIFDAATLSLGVGESAFAQSLSAKRHAHTAQPAERKVTFLWKFLNVWILLNCWHNSTLLFTI